MKLASLQDLYVEELKDLYSAETQILKALPKMAKAAESQELRSAFEEHLGLLQLSKKEFCLNACLYPFVMT